MYSFGLTAYGAGERHKTGASITRYIDEVWVTVPDRVEHHHVKKKGMLKNNSVRITVNVNVPLTTSYKCTDTVEIGQLHI